TAAFSALLKNVDVALSQREAIEFFEDWLHLITFYAEADVLSNSLSINSLRTLTIDSARKAETTTAHLSDSTSTFEQITASSKETIPEFVYFETVPYEGLAERTFVLRLSILTGGSQPVIKLRVRHWEQHQEEMAEELATKVTHALTGAEGVTV